MDTVGLDKDFHLTHTPSSVPSVVRLDISHTSLISFILEPPFPMSEPHWLAGTTSRKVTGGLLVAGLLLMELIMSWRTEQYVVYCRSSDRYSRRSFRANGYHQES